MWSISHTHASHRQSKKCRKFSIFELCSNGWRFKWVIWRAEKYIRSFFEQTLLTDQGKSIGILNETDYDAQVIYKYSHKYHTSYAKASLTAWSQLSCLIISKIDKWKDIDEYFIFYCQDELRMCKVSAPRNNKWLDSEKIIIL